MQIDQETGKVVDGFGIQHIKSCY